jgi:hypothetical protein
MPTVFDHALALNNHLARTVPGLQPHERIMVLAMALGLQVNASCWPHLPHAALLTTASELALSTAHAQYRAMCAQVQSCEGRA